MEVQMVMKTILPVTTTTVLIRVVDPIMKRDPIINKLALIRFVKILNISFYSKIDGERFFSITNYEHSTVHQQ